MVTMEEEIISTKQFFKSHHITLSDYWLESCLQWYHEENPNLDYTLETLHTKVYSQWMLLDLRDVEIPILPPNLARQKKIILNGSFSLQMLYITDISRPKLWQLQKVRNSNILANSLFGQENPQQSNNDAKRVLQMVLTDGVQEIVAIEYKPIGILHVNLAPGIKIKINGPVTIRRGRMLLEEKHVNILGGEVEELLITNAAENILARALNLPENPKPNIIEETFVPVNVEISQTIRNQQNIGNVRPLQNMLNAQNTYNNVPNQYVNMGVPQTVKNQQSGIIGHPQNKIIALNTAISNNIPDQHSHLSNVNIKPEKSICVSSEVDVLMDEESQIMAEMDMLLEAERDIAEESKRLKTGSSNVNIKPEKSISVSNEVDVLMEEEPRIMAEMDMLLENERDIAKESIRLKTGSPDIFEDVDVNSIPKSEKNENTVEKHFINSDVKNESDLETNKSIFEDVDIHADLDLNDKQFQRDHNKISKGTVTIGQLQKNRNNINSGKFTIKGRFKSVVQKLSLVDEAWSVKISVEDETGDMEVYVHSEVISNLMGYYPAAMMALKESIMDKDECAIATAIKVMEGLKSKIMKLNCLMDVMFAPNQNCPTVVNLK